MTLCDGNWFDCMNMTLPPGMENEYGPVMEEGGGGMGGIPPGDTDYPPIGPPKTAAYRVPSLIGVCFVYGFSAVGIIMNVVCIAAIMNARPMEAPIRLLLSLSCSDMFTCVAYILQQLLLGVTQIAPFFLVSSLVSVFLNVIAITMERYICIVYPLHYHSIVNEKRVTGVIVGLWLASLVFGAVCGSLFFVLGDVNQAARISNATLVSIVGVPIIAMFVLYVKVGIELRNLSHQPGAAPASTTKGIVTAALIMGSFIVCCIPTSLFVIIKGITEDESTLNEPLRLGVYDLYNIFACLSCLNSILDPCIYAFRNTRVKYGFTRMLKNFKCLRTDQVLPM